MPTALYRDGCFIEFIDVNGVLWIKYSLVEMCDKEGIQKVKGFYDLNKGGFQLVMTDAQVRSLFSRALIRDRKIVTIYAYLKEDVEVEEATVSQKMDGLDDVEVQTMEILTSEN